LATASTETDIAPVGPLGTTGDRRERLFIPWLAFVGLCVWAMWASPGREVVPYHLVWIGFALVYGFEKWPLGRTTVALVLVAAVTGSILVQRAWTGVIAWDETTEIPLMLLLAVLVVWHVRRREAALATVTRLAEREVAAAEERERLSRLTSHEMRTPLTIASGYVDLLLAHEDDTARRADLEIVRDELGRLSRAGDRLLRVIQLQDILPTSPIDMDALLRDTTQRWAAVADREWTTDPRGGTFEASRERIRACLDTLIENALRYTTEGDTVRLFCFRRGGHLWVGVADSGPGLSREQIVLINARSKASSTPPTLTAEPDPRSQTGLGIGIVQEIVAARHGRVLAGRSREGGALIAMVLPMSPASAGASAPIGHEGTSLRLS
jgi:two-component system, OmpR family, sensor kinase